VDDELAEVDMEDKLADEPRGIGLDPKFKFESVPVAPSEPELEPEAIFMFDRAFQRLGMEEVLVGCQVSLSGDLGRACC
jgi:hypothetical protein